MTGKRPNSTEYAPHFERYMKLVPEEDISAALAQQLAATSELVCRIPESRVDYRYAPGKWTTREVIGHVVDTERIFGFRLLTFARGDKAPLMVADEDFYVKTGQFSRFSLEEWMEEFSLIRRSNMALVRHLPDEAWDRVGTVSGRSISVRAIAYLMVGHERHHMRIIRDLYGIDS